MSFCAVFAIKVYNFIKIKHFVFFQTHYIEFYLCILFQIPSYWVFKYIAFFVFILAILLHGAVYDSVSRTRMPDCSYLLYYFIFREHPPICLTIQVSHNSIDSIHCYLYIHTRTKRHRHIHHTSCINNYIFF